MLSVDAERMIIKMTRGDTANLVFSAVDEFGTPYTPVAGDELKFAVSKRVGVTPLFEIANTMESDEDAFWSIEITPNLTSELKFGDYAFDVQLTTSSGIDTIIGKTDKISPTFRLWGEVATE